MKKIKDIRLFMSEQVLEDGAFPKSVSNKVMNITVRRIAMKLNEVGFMLDSSYDHIYLNFTHEMPSDTMALSSRTIDKYHPWFRFFDFWVSASEYEKLSQNLYVESLIKRIANLIPLFFSEYNPNTSEIHDIIQSVIELGENTKVLYKEKRSTTHHAMIYLRVLNTGEYCLNLTVNNKQDEPVFEVELPKSWDTQMIGGIGLSKSKVTIKPKNNSVTKAKGLSDIVYQF